jgi:hypothetical protein
MNASKTCTATFNIDTSQTIWKNGSFGAWNGQAVTGALGIRTLSFPQNDAVAYSTVNVVDNVTGGSPSLQIAPGSGLTANGTRPATGIAFDIYVNTNQDVTPFLNGSIEFDIRLETGVTSVRLGDTAGIGPCSAAIQIPVNSLSTSNFVHIAVPVSALAVLSCGTSMNTVFGLLIQTTAGVTMGTPVVTLNDIKWSQ